MGDDRMSETKIYIELKDVIKQSLDDNGLNIEDILQNENIDAYSTTGIAPYEASNSVRKKEPITIIIASSAAL